MKDQPTSPLEAVMVSCPACHKGFLENRLSPQSYRVTASDTDFYPAERVWVFPEVPNLSPLAYFMQTCPACLFTIEANDNILSGAAQLASENPQQKLQIERHAAQLAKPGSLLDKLAAGFRACPDTFSQVMLKFLVGIFDEKLKDEYSNFSLARYYLRLAWVFRENSCPGKRKNQGDWGVVKQNLERLSEQHKNYLGQVEKLRGLLEKKFMTILPSPENEPGHVHNYQEILKKLDEQILPAGEQTDHLLSLLSQKAGSRTDQELSAEDNRFNLASFLLELKTIWPGVPLNETEALKFALAYYNQYFDSLPKGAISGSKVQTAYMIGELLRRTGEYPQSRKFFSLAISLGQECMRKEKESYRSAFARKIMDLAAKQQSLAEKQQQVVPS